MMILIVVIFLFLHITAAVDKGYESCHCAKILIYFGKQKWQNGRSKSSRAVQ